MYIGATVGDGGGRTAAAATAARHNEHSLTDVAFSSFLSLVLIHRAGERRDAKPGENHALKGARASVGTGQASSARLLHTGDSEDALLCVAVTMKTVYLGLE